MSIVALIPARAGSKRVPNKNVRLLRGHPLLAYTIAVAHLSGLFSAVYVSTDSEEYAEIAGHYGAIAIKRPKLFAADDSPDIQWVTHALSGVTDQAFAILRPTSPFRTKETLWRAWATFTEGGGDSLRAMERVRQHPGKMWVWNERDRRFMEPLLPDTVYFGNDYPAVPAHSSPTQVLRWVWVQNASLEMAWTDTVRVFQSIAGERVVPFFTDDYEGFDINTPEDWLLAEALLDRGDVSLPDLFGKVR